MYLEWFKIHRKWLHMTDQYWKFCMYAFAFAANANSCYVFCDMSYSLHLNMPPFYQRIKDFISDRNKYYRGAMYQMKA